MENEDLARMIDAAIKETLPDGTSITAWESPATERGSRVTYAREASNGERRLQLMVRPDGDLQLAFHVTGMRGTPFEYYVLVKGGHEDSAVSETVDLLVGLLEERVVLVMKRGVFRGGRDFVSIGDLDAIPRKRLEWIRSWRGTYDWPRMPARPRP